MKRLARIWALVAAVVALMICAAAPGAKAQDSTINGTILDLDAKPWPDLPVQLQSEQGAKLDGKTDKDGKYVFNNLKPGVYKITIQLPTQKDPYLAGQVKVSSGQTVPADFNFKDIISKNNPEYAAAVKKQQEEKSKFQGMKQHFDLGVAALDSAKQAKTDLAKAPADQREGLKKQAADFTANAVTEFEAAKGAAPEKDPNLNLIMARLGDAYDGVGRTDDAVAAYKQAIELKPSFAYYNNMGGILGRSGKLDEATAAYQKAAEMDPAQAAQAWRNFGITMYNVQKFKEAVEPLKKSTELDPKNPQSWYLLGTVLVGSMGFKKVGDKDVPDVQPGTVDAYQHAIDLDPNGPWGQQAKQGLDMLQQIAPGIDMRVGAKKKKP